jgi:hypothetical protein
MVSLEKFCEVVGIPLQTDRQDGRIALTHTHAHESVGLGSFASSRKSQYAHPSFSTTMGLIVSGGTDGTYAFDDASNGKRLARKGPQPLHAALTKEPSKWFELPHSRETEQPLGTFAQLHFRSRAPSASRAPSRSGSPTGSTGSSNHSVTSMGDTVLTSRPASVSGMSQERGRNRHHRRVSSLTTHLNSIGDNDSITSFASGTTGVTSGAATRDGYSARPSPSRSSSAPPARSYDNPTAYKPRKYNDSSSTPTKGSSYVFSGPSHSGHSGHTTPSTTPTSTPTSHSQRSSLASYYGLVTPV